MSSYNIIQSITSYTASHRRIAVFQFLFSIPIMIPAALVGTPAVYPSELPSNLWNGLRCYVGMSTVQCDDDDGDCHTDECYRDGPVSRFCEFIGAV